MTDSRDAWLVLVAAGRGERLGAGVSKAVVDIAGRPLFTYALESAGKSEAFSGIVLVGEESVLAPQWPGLSAGAKALVRATVPGGDRRRDSVRLGLEAVRRLVASADPPVLVHDAARPFASPALFRAVAEKARHAAVVCGVRPVDTIKIAPDDVIQGTLRRDELFAAQTPQGAPLSWLERAHRLAPEEDAADCASLLERAGMTVRLHLGEVTNFKVTTPQDRTLAEAVVRAGRVDWMPASL